MGQSRLPCNFFPSHIKVPQLNRRPEAPRLLSPLVFPLLLYLWLSATGISQTGQHLQPPPHPVLSRVLTIGHAKSLSTGPLSNHKAKTCTTLFCQHWHSTPEQVREVCVLRCVCFCSLMLCSTTAEMQTCRLSAKFFSEHFQPLFSLYVFIVFASFLFAHTFCTAAISQTCPNWFCSTSCSSLPCITLSSSHSSSVLTFCWSSAQ